MNPIGSQNSSPDDDTRPLVGTGPTTGTPTPGPVLAASQQLGRYLVIEELGKGGMGVVWRAYDPKLRREVALKCIRSHLVSSWMRSRLLHEAHAMAKINHPNVVSLYDFDAQGEQVFVAMEFVDASDLRRWLDSERTTSEILEKFLQAGRGLYEAHRAGLLHRDFKPGNVLITSRGVAKVTDFGLARAEQPDRVTGGPSDELTTELDQNEATQTGEVMGTPMYMPPEQERGEPPTAAVDQYAFCVSLWWALTGRFPFSKGSGSLFEQKRSGPPNWPKKWPKETSRPPQQVVDAILRGLAADPDDRWPGMPPLLEVLERAVSPDAASARWHRTIQIGVAGSLLLGGTAWHSWSQARAERCQGARDELGGVWDETTRDAIRGAFMGIELPYAQAAGKRIEDELNSYADAWVAMHTDACEDSTVRGEQSPATMDLRMACLDRAAMSLRSVAGVLSNATPQVIENAHKLPAQLSPIEHCGDLDALSNDFLPPSSQDQHKVTEGEALIGAARAELAAGRTKIASAKFDEATTVLEGIDYELTKLELTALESDLLVETGDGKGALAAAENLLVRASKARSWRHLAGGMVASISVRGALLAEPEAALELRQQALALSDQHPALECDVRQAVNTVLFRAGKFEEAYPEAQATTEICTQALASDDFRIGRAFTNLSGIANSLGRVEEAEEAARQAIASWEESLPAGHPLFANAQINLAGVLWARGRHEEAVEANKKALKLWLPIYGPDHANIAMARGNLGMSLIELGREGEGIAELRSAADIHRRTLPETHPLRAQLLGNLADALTRSSRFEEAEPVAREALEIFDQDPPHVYTARSLYTLGLVQTGQGHFEAAESSLRRALKLRLENGFPAGDLATIRLALCEAVWQQSRPTEAREIAEQALEDARNTTPPPTPPANIEAWLAEHPPGGA